MKKILFCAICAVVLFSFFYCNEKKGVDDRFIDIASQFKPDDFSSVDLEKKLNIIVGIDYIPHELIELFEQISGIRVVVDIFDSNEILEAKLLAGGSQYDIVFPTAWPHFSRQLKTGSIYRKLDKNRIDISIFDKDLMAKLALYDKNNEYALPYQFGISGVGMDEDIIDRLVKNAPKNSLAIIFNPEIAKKLSNYRISIYESSDELFPAVLAYLGLNPESEKEEDILKAAEHLKKIRPYISKFTSFGFEDLASGSACITLSTSGDVLKVNRDNNKAHIKFFYPKEGASLWIDVMAIPKGAKHVNNAYAFFKFIFNEKVIAYLTNETSRANAVTKSAKYVDSSIINNTDIYPSVAVRKKCYIEKPMPANLEAIKTRLLTKIKSMDWK